MQNCKNCGKQNDNTHCQCSDCGGRETGRSCAYTIVSEIRRERQKMKKNINENTLLSYKHKLYNRWIPYHLGGITATSNSRFFEAFSRTVKGIVEHFDYSGRDTQQQGNKGF